MQPGRKPHPQERDARYYHSAWEQMLEFEGGAMRTLVADGDWRSMRVNESEFGEALEWALQPSYLTSKAGTV